MNRSGVDRDRDVVDVSLRGLEGGAFETCCGDKEYSVVI